MEPQAAASRRPVRVSAGMMRGKVGLSLVSLEMTRDTGEKSHAEGDKKEPEELATQGPSAADATSMLDGTLALLQVWRQGVQ